MSEPKLISPMLDGFLMGSPMSDHNGVQCCPAMKEDSDHKYIVKVISVPPSQKQLDALLLAGAYKRPEDAMDYFRALADDVVAEARILESLSKKDGFVGYQGIQVEPLERNEMGYQVYLLCSYRRSLEKHMRTTMLTQLEAVNLALDMCAALSTVRRAGQIYVDLKPTNIFITEDRRFSIGDLGFLSLDSFSYAAMPAKYISRYTPPELRDPMQNLNLTADTYSLGMVLYQVYNDGQLPKNSENPEDGFESPVNADYEMAEIILKALSPAPENRYQDPQEMGQAIAGYLQRNSVNETPITPQSSVYSEPEDIVPPEKRSLEEQLQDLESLPEPTLEECMEETAEKDETLPTAEDAPAPGEPVRLSEDVSKIVAQANELIIHETPAGIDTPEPPKRTEQVLEEFVTTEKQKDWSRESDPDYMPDPLYELRKQEALEHQAKEEKKKPRKKHTALIVSLSLLSALVLMLGTFLYIQLVVFKTIDKLTVDGNLNSITVAVEGRVDPSDLTVVCEDAFGNKIRQSLQGSQTTFQNLQADSLYRIHLEIGGMHRLKGQTSTEFTTQARTSITSFNAVVGSENGSVELNFTTEGPEPSEWVLIYGTETEETKKQVFYGHNVIIKNLSVGKIYHFELQSGGDTTIVGDGNTLDFAAVNILLAKNVQVTSGGPDVLSVHWDAPEGAEVPSWNVRCYDGESYDENMDVVHREAHFTGINPNQSYIIEVVAEGMTQTVRATITDNPITVKNFQVDDSDPDQLRFTWEWEGTAPEDGWMVAYSMDDGPVLSNVPCKTAELVLKVVVPDATYHLNIQSATGVSTFEGMRSYDSRRSETFSRFGLDGSTIETKLLKPGTPKDNIKPEHFRENFRMGTSISLFMHTNQDFKIPQEEVTIQYVWRDEYGNALPRLAAKETVLWNTIWEGANYHDGKLDLPVTPNKGGKFNITIYVDGMKLCSSDVTLTTR